MAFPLSAIPACAARKRTRRRRARKRRDAGAAGAAPLDQGRCTCRARRRASAEIDALIALAARVPDHGKLGPWRFVVIEGEARARAGDALADVIANDEGVDETRLDIRARAASRARPLA